MKIYNFYFGQSLFENHTLSKRPLKFSGKTDDTLLIRPVTIARTFGGKKAAK